MIQHEIECPQCDGQGRSPTADHPAFQCAACNGTGWRAMTSDELDAASERQAEGAMSEPPITMAEQHHAAWDQKQELNR